jgi:chromate transporter
LSAFIFLSIPADVFAHLRYAARLAELFFTVIKLSAFTLGGGYAIVAMMEREFCSRRGWLEEREMLDFTAMAQSGTGSIAINAALLVGRKVAGKIGAAVAVIGSALPPLVIMTLISFFYAQFSANTAVRNALLGMQAAVVAVIFDAALTLAVTVWRDDRLFAASVAVLAFAVTAFTSVSSAVVIAGAAAAGLIWTAGRAKLKK